MTAKNSGAGELLVKLLGKAIDGPAALIDAISVATLTVAECLVSLVSVGMASDIHDIKKSLLRKVRAEGERAVVDATDAANKVTLYKRNDAIARAQQAQLEATTERTQAQAEAIRKDADTRRQKAVAESQARLIEALAKLWHEGGDIFVDREALERLIGVGPLLPEKEVETGPADIRKETEPT